MHNHLYLNQKELLSSGRHAIYQNVDGELPALSDITLRPQIQPALSHSPKSQAKKPPIESKVESGPTNNNTSNDTKSEKKKSSEAPRLRLDKASKKPTFDIELFSKDFLSVYPKAPLLKHPLDLKVQVEEQSAIDSIFITTEQESLSPIFSALYKAINSHLGEIHHIPLSSIHLLELDTVKKFKLLIASKTTWLEIEKTFDMPKEVLKPHAHNSKVFLQLEDLNKLSTDIAVKKNTWNCLKKTFKDLYEQ